MPGLPFVSLADAIPGAERDYLGNAQYQHVKQNERELDVERAMGRPWIEPNWDLSAQQGQTQAPAQVPDQDYAFNILNEQTEVERKGHFSELDAMEPLITGSIENDLKTKMAKYNLDRDALEASDLDPEQKRQRSLQLNLQYQKDGVELRGKIRPDLDKLAAKRQEISTTLDMARDNKRIELQTLQTIGEKYGWSKKQILREQLGALGKSIPQSLMDEQTPLERYRELAPILKDWEEKLAWYQRKPAGKDWRGRLQPASGAWLEYNENTKAFDIPVPPEQFAEIENLESRVHALQPQVDDLQRQVAGSVRRGPSLESTTRSPLAQGVTAQKSSYVRTPQWGVGPGETWGRPTRTAGEPAKTLTLYARNPQTGERIMSTDGGRTWQKTQ